MIERSGMRLAAVDRTGFTLIELLVVVSIMSLLIAILLPALANSRDAARSVVCKSRLGQLGIAISAYRSDYQDFYPVHYLWGGMYPPFGSEVYRFPLQVAPYLNLNPEQTIDGDLDIYGTADTNYLQCPSNGWTGYDGVGGFAYIRTFVNAAGSYTAYNYFTPVQFGHGFWASWINTPGHDYRPKQIEPKQPSKFLLSTETAGDGRLGYVTGVLAPVQYYHPGESANMLLSDGHVTDFRADDFFARGFTYLWQ